MRKVSAATIYTALAEHGVTHLCGAQIILNFILNARDDERREISQAQAFEAALENEPRAIPSDASEADDIGMKVTISPTDYALDAVDGTLVGCSTTRYIVARESKEFGTVHVHFPRTGFECKTA